jgi:tetratricopeptide (TPR) repeat protein
MPLVATLATVLAATSALAQEPLLWGSLKPGPYAVGFQAQYQLDYTRQYDADYPADLSRPSAPRPRPIFIGIWYPAQATKTPPMAYRQYLEVPSTDPRTAPFAERLLPHMRDIVGEETTGKKTHRMNPTEAAAFHRLLALRTYAVKDTPAVPDRFPVVIDHPGLGGTYEDNSVLFEYLASHGYVVLSSAYPKADASLLNIDWNLARSFRDMEFLVHHARSLPFADVDCLAVMGHSYGAQAALAWRAEPFSAVRAVVSLDSTVENVGIDYPGFAKLKNYLQDKKQNLHVPILRFASRQNNPKFASLEPYLKFAPRYEATVASLGHNDYLSQGAIRPALLPDRWPDPKKAHALRRSYDRVCEHVLQFLEASLKHQAAAQEFLQRSLRGEGLDEEFTLQYRPPAPLPPTPRQLAQLLRSQGPERAAALLRACREDVDVKELLGGLKMTVIDYFGEAFVDEGQLKTAHAFFVQAAEIFPQSVAVQYSLGQLCELTGDRPGALAAYRKGLALVPGETTDERERTALRQSLEARLKKLGVIQKAKPATSGFFWPISARSTGSLCVRML